ncbi:MAG: Zn-ribbon domain-containing OB-fold protein [Desulfurococcales archaeon]|nr:Zn-ribbon domain-containing OB-fold protein [Desulfurococcales archaeon]
MNGVGAGSLPRWWRNRIPRYRLVGAKCKVCGRIHYPPREACPYCGSRDLEIVPLPRRGKLLSYTHVFSVPGDNRLSTPIILGLVDLGSAKVIAELTDVLPEELPNVKEVEAVVRKVEEQGGNGVIGYAIKFRPVLQATPGGQG